MRERLPGRPGISRLAELLIEQADAAIAREGGIEVFRDRRAPKGITGMTTETKTPLDAG